MGQSVNSIADRIKIKTEELRSTYDVIVTYPEYNPKTSKWEFPTLKWEKSYKYSGKEIKQLINHKLNLSANEYSLNNFKDETNYKCTKLSLEHNLQFPY